MLRVFENRVLRGVFGLKKNEVTKEQRSLHEEELNDMYSSPKIVWIIKSTRMKWANHVAPMEERRGEVSTGFWWGNLKRPLERTRRRWEDNIKMDIQELGCGAHGLDRAGSG